SRGRPDGQDDLSGTGHLPPGPGRPHRPVDPLRAARPPVPALAPRPGPRRPVTGAPEQQQIILATATLVPVTLVPEIRLYQASEPISMWQKTERATGRAGLDPPFWAFAWAGGQALARYLLDHPEAVAGRRVIDVASGAGLVAIAAALAGAAPVTAYDIDPLAAAAITVNAEVNAVTIPAVCADVLRDEALPAPGTDLVLVADAFYEQELAVQVLRFLDRARARGAAVLAGDFG